MLPSPDERILVTGGAGFLGSHLTRQLLADGHQVGVVDDLSFGRRDHLPAGHPRLHFAAIDIRRRAELAAFFTAFRPQAVIHLAALHFIPYCNAHPVEAAEINILGTDNVLACCEVVQPQAVFVASTAAVYAINDHANAETSAIGPTDIYGITKYTCERLAELHQRRSNGRVVAGRLFNIYGPNETNPHVIPEIVAQVKAGASQIELGNIEPKRDFIHTSDVAAAIWALIAAAARWPTPGFEVFNIGSGVEHSVAEIVQLCAELTGREIRIVQTAARIRQVERMHLVADISRLQAATGWGPKMDLRAGLAALLSDSASDHE
jgi:UDP-glucose 4-epimerase